MEQVPTRKRGGRQDQRTDARPWHDAKERPATPSAREHQIGDLPVQPGGERGEHAARVSSRGRLRQPCNDCRRSPDLRLGCPGIESDHRERLCI